MCPKLTDDSPSLIYCGRLVLADAYFFTGVIQCCNVTKGVVPFFFFPFSSFFVRATILVLQQQLSKFLHVLHTQPSSRTFLTDGLLCRLYCRH